MKDESILRKTGSSVDNATYINDCIKEVCLNGDLLTKYKRMIEKQYGAEFYQKCSNFVKEIKRSAKRGKFTQTSLTNLQYFANEIGISQATIDELVNHYSKNAPEVIKTPVRRNKKREKKAERKRLERDTEAKQLQEEEEKKRLQKREERRAKEAERRRQKKEEEEKQRREKERKRKEERQIQKDIEQEESIKTVIKWIGIIAALIVWLSIDGTGWIYAAVILGIVYFLVE